MYELIFYTVPLFFILIGLEVLYSHKAGKALYSRPDTVASIATGTINTVITFLLSGLLAFLFDFAHRHAVWDMGAGVGAWVLLFFLEDFTFYVFHRTAHRCRMFWAIHVNHHSSQYFNLGTALRQPWLEIFCIMFFWTWLPFIGFKPSMVLTMQSLSLIYQFWIHTEALPRLGFFEKIFNTPSHHSVHHASNECYWDKNFGGVLIVWDRIFGTFKDLGEKPVYGITSNIQSHNLLTIGFHEWAGLIQDCRRHSSWKTRFKFFLKPPGWNPNQN